MNVLNKQARIYTAVAIGVLLSATALSGASMAQVAQGSATGAAPDPNTASQTGATLPQEGPATTMSPSADATGTAAKDFVQKAYQSNEFEIAAAQVAVKQATKPAVKAYAKQALDEKLAVRADMVTAIQSATSDMHFNQDWDPAQKALLADLRSTTGKSFDGKYLKAVANTQGNAVAQFSDYAANGTDTSIKTFASTTLPKLQDNQSRVQALMGNG